MKAKAKTPAEREAACNALIFKTNVLWVQLDALYHAYVDGHIPPGAFVPQELCDGVRSVADMVDQLAAKYAAPREAIATDVLAMLQDLADKGFLTEAREKTS